MAELEFMPRCHALQHNDVGDMANMQNKSGVFDILELRLRYIEMWVKFSQPVYKRICFSQDNPVSNSSFDTSHSKTIHCLGILL